MKKVIVNLSLIIAILATVSCKNEAKSDASTSEETTQTSESRKEDSTSTESANGVPNFSDKKVQEYVNAYEAYIAEYKKAVESKDMTAFAALGEQGQELGQKAQDVMGNLSGDDVKKLNGYMQEKSTQLQELSKKLMQ